MSSFLRRLGFFLLLMGFFFIALFFISDAADSPNFFLFFGGLLVAYLGWLVRQASKPPPSDTGRFRTARKVARLGRRKKKGAGEE